MSRFLINSMMKMINLNEQDLELIKSKGIDGEQIDSQLRKFKKGTTPVKLVRSATIGDGISRFSQEEEKELVSLFAKESAARKVCKFVPASGAAARMFQTLLRYYNEGAVENDESGSNFIFLREFIAGIKERNFAFFNDLQEVLTKGGYDIDALVKKKDYKPVIDYLLNPKGLNYANLPKALLKFHKYKAGARTSLEEHLVEGIAYAKDEKNVVYIHLTISPEFEELINRFIAGIISKYKEGGITFDIRFSQQKTSTDTVAADKNNNLFRDGDNNLVLRPGGHGALIENLNDLTGDIIFIKNIDNVVPDNFKAETIKYKKILGGYLIKIQKQVFGFLRNLCAEDAEISHDELESMVQWAKKFLNISLPAGFTDWDRLKKRDYLVKKLNRPIRVCGMVKNEGEPGGGPYWIEQQDGTVSLQIIEKVQIDMNSPAAVKILKKSTHFNPVDLVCGIKDFRGEGFDLSKFVDSDAYFISKKSKDGKTLKALELPGLWNGAMADWITIFVEVPLLTFNPVKTINDLLRRQHRSFTS